MFVFDPTFANDYANVEKELQRIMERAEAEIILTSKWDERKLAFEIKKRKRGLYVLVYFRARPDRIGNIERDCRLAEHVLRVLILRADDLSRQKMEQMTTARPPAAQSERPYGRPWDRDRGRDRERGRAGKPPDRAEDSKAPVETGDKEKDKADTEAETIDAVAQVDEEKPSS